MSPLAATAAMTLAATAAIRSAAATGAMKPAAAIAALALLTYFQFPGHTWLQQDSQIYAPILEHQFDAQALRNDIVVQHPHVAFTLYDEAALFLRGIGGRSFQSVPEFQQIATRALDIWGLYLMAAALGLSAGPALTVAAICSLGTSQLPEGFRYRVVVSLAADHAGLPCRGYAGIRSVGNPLRSAAAEGPPAAGAHFSRRGVRGLRTDPLNLCGARSKTQPK
jgi:hypothetical protein